MSGRDIIQALEDLVSEDGEKRTCAREVLVAAGSEAVPSLLELLRDGPHIARWEACLALCDIADPQAAPGLVRALTDEEDDVRWLAAEALLHIGRAALPPLFDALVAPEEPLSPWLRRGAHHVLRGVRARDRDETLRAALDPVIEALERHDDGDLPIHVHRARGTLHV